MSNFEKEVEKALAIRREIIHEIKEGKVSRRAMLKTLLYTSGTLAALYQLRGENARGASGPGGGAIAPPTTPFVEEMPHLNLPPHVAQPALLDPQPEKFANTARGEARRDPHQAWESAPVRKTYELKVREAKHSFHPELPPADIWGFDGKFPGSTFHARYNEPIVVRVRNELPDSHDHVGFGSPEISTHLHNMHSPSESDGNPLDFYPKRQHTDPGGDDPGTWKDFHWVNKYAGFDSTHKSFGGDPLEALATLWYHDHRVDFTAQNVYRGLAGFYLIFDELDSGDETDTGPGLPLPDGRVLAPLRLPSGEFDVPIIYADKLFDGDGNVVFDFSSFDGLIGNKPVTVNGKIQPFFPVKRRKYRFRFLNSGPSRVLGIRLFKTRNANGDLSDAVPYENAFLVGLGGNLLHRRLPLQRLEPLLISPSQRWDVVVDFSGAEVGEHIYMVNVFDQTNGRMPNGFFTNTVEGPLFREATPGVPLLRFDVVGNAEDPSQVPERLRPLPSSVPREVLRLSEAEILAAVDQPGRLPGVDNVRHWRFDRSNGQWTVNNELFNGEEPRAVVAKNGAEIWVLQNNSNGWVHPIHIHLEEFFTLFRGGVRAFVPEEDVSPPEIENTKFGRRDTLTVGPGERIVIFQRHRDFNGRYVMHCHNVVHEDHAMMVRWDVAHVVPR